MAGIFSEMNSELAVSRKDRYFFPMKKIQVFERESDYEKLVFTTTLNLLDNFPVTAFLMDP